MNKKMIALILASTTQFMGCAQLSRLDAKIEPKMAESQSVVDAKLKKVADAKNNPYITETTIPFISNRVIPQSTVDSLPAFFREQVTVNETFSNLNAIADYVYSKFNVSVFIDKKVSNSEVKSTSTGGVGGPFSASVTAPKQSSAGNTEIGAIFINYKNGTLKGLLDTIADKQGINWKYESNSNTIKFFLTETKYFVMNVSPLKKRFSNSISQNGTITSGTGQNGSGSKQSVSVDYSIDQPKALEDNVKKMLSKDGDVRYNEATSTLMVTDTPNILAEVSKYVDLQQKIISKNAIVTLKTYELSASDADALGIDATIVYSSADRGYGYRNVGNDTDTTLGGVLGAGITAVTNKFKGSSITLNALAQQGKAKVLKTANLRLFNNEPVNSIIGKERNYLKSIENTTTSGSTNTQSKLESGTLETGFSVAMQANIAMDNSMILSFTLFNGDLVGNKIDTFTSGSSSIQLPNLNKFQINQTFPVRSGETVLLMGFETEDEGIDKKGTLSPDNVLFGGGSNLNKERKVLVIELTPVVLN